MLFTTLLPCWWSCRFWTASGEGRLRYVMRASSKLNLNVYSSIGNLISKAILPEIRINRGSYMSAHVLLNLLNELGKRDKMRGLPSILSLFCNEFKKFNNTRARMLDSIYLMTPDIITNLNSIFWHENVKILPFFTRRYNGRHNVSRKSINH